METSKSNVSQANLVPFAIILGEDELRQGKVRIKEMGLKEGHPEKDGVLVDLGTLTRDVIQRLDRKRELDEMTRQAEGLRVVHGIRGEDVALASAEATTETAATNEATTATEPTTS